MYLPASSPHRGTGLASSTATACGARKPGRKPAVQTSVKSRPSVSATPAARINWKKWTVVRTSRATATRTAPKARLNVPSATDTPDCFSLCGVLGVLIEARQEVGVLARRGQRLRTVDAHAQADQNANRAQPNSSQQMPLAIDWRKVSLTRRKMTEKVVLAFMMRLLRRSVQGLSATHRHRRRPALRR